MSLSSTNEANRYFVYDLTSAVDSNGGMSFGIPAVNENQFGTSRACLIKLSKVQLGQSGATAPIDWAYTAVSGSKNVYPEGIMIESNLVSRNYAHISNERGDDATSGTGQNQSSVNFNALSQRLSIPIYSETADAIKYISYDDQNSIFDNGLICSMPFGQVIRFEFKEGVKNKLDTGSRIAPTSAGGVFPTNITGWLGIRLEIFILDQQ
tara:strand:+ start:157 stop:783 length:627 start_codon:yes stop_codon:yes gene_type:complete